MGRTLQVVTDQLALYYTAAEYSDLSELGALELRGLQASDTLSQDYREKWLAYVRDAGTPGGTANRRFLGGDVLDVVQAAAGGFLWIGADAWAGGTTAVDPDDTFITALLPFRNYEVLEQPLGTLTNQVFTGGGSGGNWLDPTADGGLPADRVWWTTGGVSPTLSLAATDICAHQLAGGASGSLPAYGLEDTVLIRLNAFGTYTSRVTLGFGPAGNFWLEHLRHDPASGFVYGWAQSLDVPVQPPLASTDLDGWRGLPPQARKVSRVPVADLRTPASWQFWDGSGWSSSPAAAVPVEDPVGNTHLGLSGAPVHVTGAPDTGLGSDYWVTVGRSNVLDPFLDVWRAPAIQGPYTRSARVPIPALAQGLQPQSRYSRELLSLAGAALGEGVYQVSHHATLLPHLTSLAPPPDAQSPAGYRVACCTSTLLGPGTVSLPWNELPIGTFCPQFVAVPI